MTANHRYFSCLMLLAASPAEACALEVIKDDRVAKRLLFLISVFNTHTGHLENVSMHIYNRFCAYINDERPSAPATLRSKVLTRNLVAYAYIDRNLFQEASEYPWAMARGDPDEHLNTLSQPKYLKHWRPMVLFELLCNHVRQKPAFAIIDMRIYACYCICSLLAVLKKLGHAKCRTSTTNNRHVSRSD